MTSLRQKLAQASVALGITIIAERLANRRGLLVLTYHRIGDPLATPFDPGTFSASASEFEWQIEYLKRRFQVATLDEAIWLSSEPSRFRRLVILITFDDGYRDNYSIAFPVLRAHNLQATFFLMTSFIGASRLPWWDSIAYLVRHTRKEKIRLQYPFFSEYELCGETSTSLRRILRLYKSMMTVDTERFMRELSDECEVSIQDSAAERLFIDWGEAREMVQYGMSVGSHTHSHLVLSKLAPLQQCKELQLSRSLLEAELSIKIRAVAFPVGSISAFDETTMKIAKESGYEAAFSHYGGFNRYERISSFNLLRVGVEAGTSASLFRLRYSLIPQFGRVVV